MNQKLSNHSILSTIEATNFTMKARYSFVVFVLFLCFLNYVPSCSAEGNCAGYDPLTNQFPNAYDISYGDRMCRSKADQEHVNSRRRSNGIHNFCLLVDISTQAPPGYPPIQFGESNAKEKCYPETPPPANNLLHSAGPNPHWYLLNHLTAYRAQSYQPYDDMPFVDDRAFNDPYFLQLSPIPKPNPLPVPGAPNPYFVEVSGISMKGELLHNFLHFRIFANRSVALGKDQDGKRRNQIMHGVGLGNDDEKRDLPEKPNYAKGTISALLIMVKDQDGWPVGDFSTPIPCHRTCSKFSHDVYYGDENNAVPCSFTPPYATEHPGMFLYDSDPGRYCPHVGNMREGPPNPADPRVIPQLARRPGVREVHATWKFGHSSCNFVQRLYIQTLIFEDVETVYRANFTNPNISIDPFTSNFMFGWSAQYNIIKPTKESLGAADYVDLKYFKECDERSDDIDCHVPLFDSVSKVKSPFQKFLAPAHSIFTSDTLSAFWYESRVPSRQQFKAALFKIIFRTQTKYRYMGQYGIWAPDSDPAGENWRVHLCRDIPESWENPPELLSTALLKDDKDHLGLRCPCPALPSPEPLENRTADPARLHGRLIHASHMAIAYMFLTPIGCFVVRYYKETFVTVFCFQEYWWYMWHVVTLMVACLFNIGAITSIARKKQAEIKYNENLLIHIIFGAISIFVFYMEMVTGFFRVANPKKRMRQIFTHWLIGTLNNVCAVSSMFAMAWVDQSGFSCSVAATTGLWLLFVIGCYAVMEFNMRKIDKRLKLVPRRSYLPPPVKRLFTREPPGRSFRISMLIFFIVGLALIQLAMSFFIWNDEAGASCEQELSQHRNQRRNAALGIDNEAEGGGDQVADAEAVEDY